MSQQLAVQIGTLLRENGLRLALAESCTGGLIGDRITNVPGSSEYFVGGVVAYSYEAKAALLGVSWDTLNSRGAVSREAVLEMARGARKAMNADVALAISGIAGPGGGTIEKPVGTTWVGIAAEGEERAREFCFSGDRLQNKSFAADAALQMLFDFLRANRAAPGLDQKAS